MSSKSPSSQQRDAHQEEEQALLAACRVLVAVSAQSIAVVEDSVDLIEFRALVIVASRGPVSLSELADAAGLHLSRASRLCDRMVGNGLINRADDPSNRRQLTLTVTAKGNRLIQTVMRRRRQIIQPIVDRLHAQVAEGRRAELVTLFRDFAVAAGEPADTDLWAMGWSS